MAALTAGPGVTNGMSAIASAQQNHSPMLVLGGRAPAMRWGQGSLQEIDHVPFVRPLTKLAATRRDDRRDPRPRRRGAHGGGHAALRARLRRLPARPRVLRGARARRARRRCPTPRAGPVADGVERAAALLRDAERPVIMAGTNLYWGHGEEALRRARARSCGIPVFLNGLARGCVPADHELFFSRARARTGSRAPTSRSSSACRWTSGSASAARSARRPRSS